MATYLDFERPIAEIRTKLEELSQASEEAGAERLADEVARLRRELDHLIAEIYGNLSRHQVCQLARHPDRPYFLDYAPLLFEDFTELHGDRALGDDGAIVGGIARFHGVPVVVVGQQKGRDVKERQRRNFGMPRPEGYRKAKRLFELAERFSMPLLTFVDTPGAWPGIDAEEHGQSEAIARNLYVLSGLRVPVIATVIGEGGSGGALAIGFGDRLLMQQFATYSVISPEGCAAILWRDRKHAPEAAEALRPTAKDLLALGIIDGVVPEPPEGAHRDPKSAAELLDRHLHATLEELLAVPPDALVAARREKLRRIGVFEGAKRAG